jgi:hypothetical protein
MKVIHILTIALICNLFVNVSAWAASDWSSYSQITVVNSVNEVAGASNGVYIYVASGSYYNDNCTSTPSSYFLPDEAYTTANSKYKTELAQIMAAYMNQRPVSFYVKGCLGTSSALVGAVSIN